MDKFFTRPQRYWLEEAGKTTVMYAAAFALLYRAAWKTNWLRLAAADIAESHQENTAPTENNN